MDSMYMYSTYGLLWLIINYYEESRNYLSIILTWHHSYCRQICTFTCTIRLANVCVCVYVCILLWKWKKINEIGVCGSGLDEKKKHEKGGGNQMLKWWGSGLYVCIFSWCQTYSPSTPPYPVLCCACCVVLCCIALCLIHSKQHTCRRIRKEKEKYELFLIESYQWYMHHAPDMFTLHQPLFLYFIAN